ncbi:helix-turn-helix domain-containing protein [Burkholderia gladioli]|uniref:Transcriptional regulator, XRE family n=1 Tax=Burkholderia gladioli (strain BSR3) TaxID=999541 RepID=F2LB40_BURGS|nr:helix-turn-helix transcriptional regulator [Burkholderia gladioli]AEA60109.1 transcriptional regulator, XRE family [Burkholderia gladioli BSR3]MBU9268730.1 helix-turn-helix domain-containing protein [Burkholderia gladioli]MCH7268234.1 helix-turn-helix domain-containing protein [Burkholderia gladioli]MDJ1162974.1 helix-turn-helix transcriptional regulator [Burkholderia gladioli pv. gladioli]MDN7806334.1 helix-turn-helix transcriptional regulator [Burkholderia gladioli]
MSVLALRLKDARQRAGLSQERLGIEAGLDPMSASTRMNRYELGKRVPDVELVTRLAVVLKVPAAYFYAVDDVEAEMLLKFHGLTKSQQQSVLSFMSELSR